MNDLISRQAAIDAMMRLQTEDIEMYGCAIPEGFDGDRAAEALKALPSIQPEHKTGEWLEREVHEKGVCEDIEEWQSAKCSVCGRYHTTPYMYFFKGANYCPHCGADMRVESDE